MASTTYITSMANAATIRKEWLLVDAENETLGRLASKVAMLVRGKHKAHLHPAYRHGRPCGGDQRRKGEPDRRQVEDKEYQRYSGYPGGQRIEKAKDLKRRKPQDIVGTRRAWHAAPHPSGPRPVQQPARGDRQRARARRQKPRKIDLNSIK
jgi:large subunit ribosomal protein L13